MEQKTSIVGELSNKFKKDFDGFYNDLDKIVEFKNPLKRLVKIVLTDKRTGISIEIDSKEDFEVQVIGYSTPKFL